MRRIAAIALMLTACTAAARPATTEARSWDTSPPFVGFSLSPPDFDEQGLDQFFARVGDGADLVAWVGAWQDLERGGTLVYELSAEHGYVPVVVTGFPTDADGRRVVPEEPGEMVDVVSEWVAAHPIPFLGFGVETNAFLWEKAPVDFEWLVATFPELARAVHEVAPSTVVFPGFQLERLRGLRDGVFGGERVEPDWGLIDRFPDADAIGFTTYPGLIHVDPADVPGDYYEEILDHTDKPIVFTEVGWQAGGDLGSWTGTPEKQEDFVAARLPELAEMSEMVIWSFLYDQEAGGSVFESMGLVDANGRERPSWATWLEVFS